MCVVNLKRGSMSTTAHFQDLLGLISCKAVVIGVKFDLLPACKQRLEYILQDENCC